MLVSLKALFKCVSNASSLCAGLEHKPFAAVLAVPLLSNARCVGLARCQATLTITADLIKHCAAAIMMFHLLLKMQSCTMSKSP